MNEASIALLKAHIADCRASAAKSLENAAEHDESAKDWREEAAAAEDDIKAYEAAIIALGGTLEGEAHEPLDLTKLGLPSEHPFLVGREIYRPADNSNNAQVDGANAS